MRLFPFAGRLLVDLLGLWDGCLGASGACTVVDGPVVDAGTLRRALLGSASGIRVREAAALAVSSNRWVKAARRLLSVESCALLVDDADAAMRLCNIAIKPDVEADIGPTTESTESRDLGPPGSILVASALLPFSASDACEFEAAAGGESSAPSLGRGNNSKTDAVKGPPGPPGLVILAGIARA